MIKEYLKNPNFYYVSVPGICVLWAFYMWAFAVPNAEDKWEKTQSNYIRAQEQITRILMLDPSRLEFEGEQEDQGKFDFSMVFEQFARTNSIPSSAYSLQAGREIKRGGRVSKTANVKVDEISIEKIANFFSTVMLRWPDLQCDQLKISKVSGGPNVWDVSMRLTYYF